MTFAQAGKVAVYGLLAVLIASCTGSRAPKPVAPGGPITGPVDYSRPHRDGAPWWDVDVSRIPDAVPMPHYGRVKANRVLNQCRISPAKTIGGLSERQRGELVAMLRR